MAQDHFPRESLNQFFTPRWAAEAIVERYFSGLPAGATVLEPSCGDGRFLLALPDHLDAIGVELDPQQAQKARDASGRRVITGNFLEVDRLLLPERIDAVVGNPPFVAETVHGFLGRAHELLIDGGRCGFILPAYVLQTSSKVMMLAKDWSIHTELMPRNLFPGLSLPITFTVFTKERARRLQGLFLYRETSEVGQLAPAVRELLHQGSQRGSIWRAAVRAAFDSLGQARAHLKEIYGALERRPTANPNWAPQVRKVLQTYPEFKALGRGMWGLDLRLAAAA